ncbi:MAG: ribosomal-protein-alanine N-acetyltransferase [Parvicella sp.]|jgi:ribosomal-protein-alanine N-acetyltransferase
MHFSTNRLHFRKLIESDRAGYFDLMGNPNVMHPIPTKTMTKVESDAHFDTAVHTDFSTSDRKLLAVDVINGQTNIGIGAFLFNDLGEPEIGYRLREQFWGNGYGSEMAHGIIEYGFNHMNYEIMTGDAAVANIPSIKILEKYMNMRSEYYSEEYKCVDRRYEVTKEQWNEKEAVLRQAQKPSFNGLRKS